MTISAQASVPTGTYTANPIHSTFAFAVGHNETSTFRSRFKDVAATLRSDGTSISIEGGAKVDSLDIGLAAFREHLLSEEFFDAAAHPELTFRSTAVRHDGEQIEVDGELTIRGVSKPVTAQGVLGAPATNPHGKTVVGMRLEAAVDRTDYGITWNLDLPSGGKALGSEVTILVDLEFDREG